PAFFRIGSSRTVPVSPAAFPSRPVRPNATTTSSGPASPPARRRRALGSCLSSPTQKRAPRTMISRPGAVTGIAPSLSLHLRARGLETQRAGLAEELRGAPTIGGDSVPFFVRHAEVVA